MKRLTLVSLIALVALVAAAAAEGGLGIPKPKPAALAKPFTGSAVGRAWLGSWRIASGGDSDGVVWRFYAASSPWCKSITGGHTTCFTMQPPGHLELWAGAVTLFGRKVVLRMTYKPRPNTFGCFADDAYNYRISSRTLTLLNGGPRACFFDQPGQFPVTLSRRSA